MLVYILFLVFLFYLLILCIERWDFGHLCARQIVTKQSRSLTLRLQNKSGNGGLRNLGAITVHAEETVASKSVVEMVLRCSRLDNKDVFSKSVLILHSYYSCFFIWMHFILFCLFSIWKISHICFSARTLF